MLDKLNESEWAHFTDRCYFRQLLNGKADILLIGNARSGKKTLLACLMLSDNISIECSIVNTHSGVQREFFRQLSLQAVSTGLTHNIRSFEAALRLLHTTEKHEKTYYVVFRNAEKFYEATASGFTEFFRCYLSFAEEMRVKCGILLQAIVLSRTDLPLSFPRCYLPYPDPGTLKRFILDKAVQVCKQKYSQIAHFTANMKQFVLQCAGFVILFRDFESFEILVRKLLYMLKRSFAQVLNGNYAIKDQFFFLNCRTIFYQTPKVIYMRKKDLALMTDRKSVV